MHLAGARCARSTPEFMPTPSARWQSAGCARARPDVCGRAHEHANTHAHTHAHTCSQNDGAHLLCSLMQRRERVTRLNFGRYLREHSDKLNDPNVSSQPLDGRRDGKQLTTFAIDKRRKKS